MRPPSKQASNSASGTSSALGLLDLPDNALERILACLPQHQLRCTIPLVCKRLNAVQKGSQVLWRSIDFLCPAVRYPQRLLDWVEARKPAIKKIFLYGVGWWPEQAAAVLAVLAPALQRLLISNPDVVCTHARMAQLLAPLAEAAELRVLDVSLSFDSPVQLPALPCLHKLQALEVLDWSVHDPRPPPGLSALSRLTRLSISNADVGQWAPAICSLKLLHLDMQDSHGHADSVLAAMKGLQQLTMTGAGLTVLPDSVASLTSLSHLSLDFNFFSQRDPWCGLRPLAPSLAVLSLNTSKLTCLPTQLYDLSNLMTLFLCDNKDLDFDFEELSQLLSRLARLTVIIMSDETSRQLNGEQWIKMGRAFPDFNLSLMD